MQASRAFLLPWVTAMPSLIRSRQRGVLGWLMVGSLVLTLLLGLSGHGQATTPGQLVQAGVLLYEAGNYGSALEQWRTALETLETEGSWGQQAIVHENMARAYQQVGQSDLALTAWGEAIRLHRQFGDTTQLNRALTEQAQVYLSLGQHRRAIALLCLPLSDTGTQPPRLTQLTDCEPSSALVLAQDAGDVLGEVAALGSLGEAYRLRGNAVEADLVLRRGLALAQSQQVNALRVPLLNSLGNLVARQAQLAFRRAEGAAQLGIPGFVQQFSEQAEAYEAEAQDLLEQALALAPRQSSGEFQTRLNLLPIYRRQGNSAAIAATRQRLGDLINGAVANRETTYGAIALARSVQPLGTPFGCGSPEHLAEAQRWLNQGLALANHLEDRRAASFALGELGHLAECQNRWATALDLTLQAQVAATDRLTSADSLYLWQWQAGRIHRQQGRTEAAIAAYNQAVETLESIRTEILVADQDVQLDFRDTVEPIYRELIALQLATVAPDLQAAKQADQPSSDSPKTAAVLESALVTADALRLAELQNYFGNDCILNPVAQARVDLLAQSSRTAVISSVILADRTALIANIPGQPPELIWVADNQTLRDTVIAFRLGLERYFNEVYDTTPGLALYDRLIRPLEPALQAAQIDTLVFVHDGFLRSVPMAALYDGQQFLIEKYAIATTPALTLTAPESDRLETFQALVLGSSQAVTVEGIVFTPLPAVPREVEAVVNTLPGSQVYLDEAFSQGQLRQALSTRSYPVLHFATHGQFSPDPANTFIVTGQGEKVTFGQLETFVRSGAQGNEKIDLVVLTACETATGDDRATLGLAGVAIRAGARSAIATLWRVDDPVTAQLTQDFYQYLKDPTLNKAQALQKAQIAALRQGGRITPGKWAPFLLVGNWL